VGAPNRGVGQFESTESGTVYVVRVGNGRLEIVGALGAPGPGLLAHGSRLLVVRGRGPGELRVFVQGTFDDCRTGGFRGDEMWICEGDTLIAFDVSACP